MGFISVSGPPRASSPTGPGLYNRPSVMREHNSVLMVRRTPSSVLNSRTGFFSSRQSGARGEGWLHASDDSCWHARVIKPNETAHCSQRMDTGRGSNPPPSAVLRFCPAFITWIWTSLHNRSALARVTNVQSGKKVWLGEGLLKGRAGGVEPAAGRRLAPVC